MLFYCSTSYSQNTKISDSFFCGITVSALDLKALINIYIFKKNNNDK